MPTLNADIPQFYAWVRAEYLHNLESHFGELVKGCVFGVSAIEGLALGFHVLLENGACIWRLPIQAIRTDTESIADHPIAMKGESALCRYLQLWDCFSYRLAVTEFRHLSGLRCRVVMRDGLVVGGEYQFTIDWYGNDIAESPGDGGHKCHHIIELDDGFLAAQPNNRVAFFEPATIKTFPADQPPKYKTNNQVWKVEQGDKWSTSDDDLMFYGVHQCQSTNGKTSTDTSSKPSDPLQNGIATLQRTNAAGVVAHTRGSSVKSTPHKPVSPPS